MTPTLRIAGYDLAYRTRAGLRPALTGIDIAIAPGETLGLVGASGSGKTSLAWSILRMLPGNAREGGGTIQLAGEDLRAMTRRQLAALRGRRIGMVFQDPSTALNPVQPIGHQLQSVWLRHFGGRTAPARARAIELLERVGVRNAADRLGQYPHQLSGGLKQRVLIAMALIAGPSLLLADEPTTALDVTVQARVLNLLRDLQRELGIGILLITHDLGVVAAAADRVAVMYAGEIVETGAVAEVLVRPAHPYTSRLLACVPELSGGARLGTIAGEVPKLTALPEGCGFAPRCALATEACRAAPVAMHVVSAGHAARCLRTDAVLTGHG